MLKVTNLTKRKIPSLPLAKVADKILGKSYALSLVFCLPSLSRSLNRRYRRKDKATNILSFPLEKKAGEIFINLTQTQNEARKFSATYENHLLRLFIHGCLHLKGFTHGSKMESEERRLLSLFIVKDGQKHCHRVGHRYLVSARDRVRTAPRRKRSASFSAGQKNLPRP